MNDYTSYPLSWPIGWRRSTAHECARFSKRERQYGATSSWTSTKAVTISEAIRRLFSEIKAFTKGGYQWRINPDRVVVSTNVRVKLDGLPYSNAAEPSDSGVAVYFKLDDRPTVLACDKWNRVADNIAAIAAHLGALRGQERWGVGSIEQAFAGYAALNEKTEPSCWEILEINSSATRPQILDAYRRKCRETHPDTGGSAEAFERVVRAKDIALSSQSNGTGHQ